MKSKINFNNIKIITFLRSMNIKKRLIFSFAILSVTPMAFITFFVLFTTFNDSEIKNKEYVVNISSQISNNIKYVFDKYEDKINRVAFNSAILADVQNYTEDETYRNIYIKSRVETALASSVGTSDGVLSIGIFSRKHDKFFYGQEIELNNKDKYNNLIVNDIKWEIRNNKYLYLIKKINFQYGSSSVGFIVLKIDLDYINKVTQKNVNDKNYEVIIINSNGTIISHKNKEDIFKKLDIKLFNRINYTKNYGSISNLFEIKDGKETYFVCYNDMQINNWKIISMFSKSVILKGVLENSLKTIGLSLGCLLISLLLLLLVIKSIKSPIINLINEMDKMGHGDLNEKKIEDESNINDEHAVLTDNFNEMNIRLNRLIEDVYNSKIKEKELEFLKKEAELNALQQQINPHFLNNILEAIFWKAQMNGNEEIGEMVTALGDFFRTSIDKHLDYITINDEIKNVKNYIYLQKIRFGEKFTVNWEINEDTKKYKTAKLVLQPIVENAIIHGIQNISDKGLISIRCYKKNSRIIFEVEDNGKGISKKQVRKLQEYINGVKDYSFRGVGIKNVNQRIKLFFGDKYGIYVKSNFGKGTIFTLEIPVFENDFQI